MFRFSVGRLSGSGTTQVANEGRIIRFDDNTGEAGCAEWRPHEAGPDILRATHISGNYAFGEVGDGQQRRRFAAQGLYCYRSRYGFGYGSLGTFSAVSRCWYCERNVNGGLRNVHHGGEWPGHGDHYAPPDGYLVFVHGFAIRSPLYDNR